MLYSVVTNCTFLMQKIRLQSNIIALFFSKCVVPHCMELFSCRSTWGCNCKRLTHPLFYCCEQRQSWHTAPRCCEKQWLELCCTAVFYMLTGQLRQSPPPLLFELHCAEWCTQEHNCFHVHQLIDAHFFSGGQRAKLQTILFNLMTEGFRRGEGGGKDSWNQWENVKDFSIISSDKLTIDFCKSSGNLVIQGKL